MKIVVVVLALLASSCGSSDSSAPPTAKVAATTAPAVVVATGPRTIDLGDGLVVDIVEDGTGAALKSGDVALLEYVITYVPQPETAAKHDAAQKKYAKGDATHDAAAKDPKHPAKHESTAKDAKTDEPHDAAKSDAAAKDAKSDGAHDAAAPAATKKDEPVVDAPVEPASKPVAETEAPIGAPADASATPDAKPTDAQSADAKPADVKSTDAKPSDEKPTEEKPTDAEKPAESTPPAPLAPIVVVSTIGWTEPTAVKLDARAKNNALPGLQRALIGLKVGTHARITVPAALAYGKNGLPSSNIPPETPLSIDVHVRGVRG